jgi:hypothetical protein
MMARTRAAIEREPDDIARDIRSELRSILRLRRDLYAPLRRFEPIADPDSGTRYYVLFDTHPRKAIRGLKLGGLTQLRLPDERICDRVLEFAKAVWHLKDRLHRFAKTTGQLADLEGIADKSTALRVCADLANQKKHGRSENRSNLNPCLDLVVFDTSKNGSVELYYDGAMKDKEVIVANPNPIPYTVDVLINGDSTVLGDARQIIDNGLTDWLPVVQQLGLLSAADPETNALRTILIGDAYN